MDNWLDAVQDELTKLDPMLRIRVNEISISFYHRGMEPDLSALAYYDWFLHDMKSIAERMLKGTVWTDLLVKWR